MPLLAPAFTTINPAFYAPEKIMVYSQASNAFDLLAGGAPQTKLGEGDLAVYYDRLDIRTRNASGQAAYNELPGVDIVMEYVQTPTYLNRVRAEYDLHDTATAGRRGVAIDQAFRLGMRQSHAQILRNMALYGMQPSNGEGLINATGATAISLPPDQNGNQTVVTYDNGAMAFFILQQITNIKTRTLQFGVPNEFVIVGPQRVLGAFELAQIVQLVQYQRPGAGSQTTAGVVEDVAAASGNKVKWGYDDTLIGKGAGGTDAVLITMPELKVPLANSAYNTNAFAELTPGLSATTLMLNDMAAPREITTPLAGGAVDVISELRSTSGWGVRGECVTVVSLQYQ